MERNEKVFWGIMAVMVLSLSALFLARLAEQDHSARQQEQAHRLGAVYMTLNNPFYEVVDEEIRAALEEKGYVLLSRDPALDAGRQTEEVQELIADGVELIFLNPVDWQQAVPALEAAYKAGIPVIAIDTNVQDDRYVACTVVSDNYLAGQQCAEHLASQRQGGQIALLKHTQARSSLDRMKGFSDTIARYPGFSIVDEEECLGQLEFAMPATERMLDRHPGIDIIMALNDPAAMGALAALQSVGRLDRVMVYGVDGVAETKEMIRAGHMTATAEQQPRRIGQIAASQAIRMLAGEDVEHFIQLPTRLLTKENLAETEGEGWN